jgi:hypothetical protein
MRGELAKTPATSFPPFPSLARLGILISGHGAHLLVLAAAFRPSLESLLPFPIALSKRLRERSAGKRPRDQRVPALPTKGPAGAHWEGQCARSGKAGPRASPGAPHGVFSLPEPTVPTRTGILHPDRACFRTAFVRRSPTEIGGSRCGADGEPETPGSRVTKPARGHRSHLTFKRVSRTLPHESGWRGF